MEREQAIPEESNKVEDAPGIVISLDVTCSALKEGTAKNRTDVIIIYLVRTAARPDFCEEARWDASSLVPNTNFKTVYRFGEVQIIRFDVYCHYKGGRSPEFLGRAECTPLDMVIYLNTPYKKTLLGLDETTQVGSVTIVPTAANWPPGYAALQFSATDVPLKEVFKTADSMLELWRVDKTGRGFLVHATEVVPNNPNPTWQPFVVNKEKLGDPSDNVEVRCLDVHLSGERKIVGKFWTTPSQLACGSDRAVTFAVQETRKPHPQEEPLMIQLSQYRDFPWFFIDYLHGDFAINFAIVVDLSSSNGTLHTLRSKPNRYNLYENAIRAFSDVIQQYDEDQMIPAIGFGAKTPPSLLSDNVMFLNGPDNLRCRGVKGVLEAYKTKIAQVELAEPSEVGPSISYLAKMSRDFQATSKYYVVLVFTDGKMDYTFSSVESLIQASSSPMSVIFVGIGEGDFPFFKEIQGEKLRKRPNNMSAAKRDFVKTVVMGDFVTSKKLYDMPREALADVPDHIMQYMVLNNIEPKHVSPPIGDTVQGRALSGTRVQ